MKDYRSILKAIRRTEGWETRYGKGGHVKVYRNGKFTGVSIPASGSSQRNLANDSAALKRAGLPLGDDARARRGA